MEATLLEDKKIPRQALLAICEYTCEKLDGFTPENVILIVDCLKGMLYKGERNDRRKFSNPWGCKGRPEEVS